MPAEGAQPLEVGKEVQVRQDVGRDLGRAVLDKNVPDVGAKRLVRLDAVKVGKRPLLLSGRDMMARSQQSCGKDSGRSCAEEER